MCAATEYLWIFWLFFSSLSAVSLFTAIVVRRKKQDITWI